MSTPFMIKSAKRFLTQDKHLPIALGVVDTSFVLWLQIDAPTFVTNIIQRLEYLVYDARLDLMPKAAKSPDNKIVIVDLDERSLQV